MALISDYTAGTISVDANGTAVTGVGTAWQAALFQEGDWFIANGWVNIVAAVNSNTSLTLAQPWRGGALSGVPYRLRYMSDGSRSSAQARQLINMLGNSGSLEALAALIGANDTLPYFTGPGVMALTPFTALARSLLDDTTGAAMYATMGQIPNEQVRNDLTPDKAFRRGNILGTVSQSGGVPTGALVERGSNANGEFGRFADGFQYAYINNIVLERASTNLLRYSWTFPSSFLANSYFVVPRRGTLVSDYVNIISTDVGLWGHSGGATSTNFDLFRVTGAPAVAVGASISNVSLYAAGRWF